MSETTSEKIVKDSLKYATVNNLIVASQKITTPMYQKEPVDFMAWDNTGRCYLLEVKETKTSSLSPTAYNDVQMYMLTRDEFNQEDGYSKAYTVVRFYSGDKNRNHSQYYELYFLVPGFWIDEIKISIQNCRNKNDAILLGGYEYGDYFDLSDEYGLSTKGNATKGLKEFPFYNL